MLVKIKLSFYDKFGKYHKYFKAHFWETVFPGKIQGCNVNKINTVTKDTHKNTITLKKLYLGYSASCDLITR